LKVNEDVVIEDEVNRLSPKRDRKPVVEKGLEISEKQEVNGILEVGSVGTSRESSTSDSNCSWQDDVNETDEIVDVTTIVNNFFVSARIAIPVN